MAEIKTMNVRFQQKYDTAANWEASTFELLAGEIAVESDTGKFKFGNGTDVFKDLPYAGIDKAQLDAIEDNFNNAVANLQTAVSNVYTKTEAEGKFVEKEDGKALISTSEIARLITLKNYDDTEVKNLIANITKEGGAIEEAVAAEAAIARAAEKKNADDIIAINALLNTISDTDDITSLKELAIWVEEHGKDAAEMTKSITANTEAIAAITNGETGILALAKGYTDSSISALQASIHGVDDKTIKLNENKAYVAEVSTDVLVQGTKTLVLNAGTASTVI
jgi:hypothetical protein